MRKLTVIVLLLLTWIGAGQAQENASPDWSKWQFLIGSWNAAGKGDPGEGKGGFSFALDLQTRVLIRKNHTDYPAAANRPAFAHDDLMIVYLAGPQQQFRADYYDNEGHVIHYAIEFSNDGRTCTFVSDITAAQQRFRLTYTQIKAGQVGIKFEIAPPNDPEKFKVYVEGTAQKR
jgi:hypothetical protein